MKFEDVKKGSVVRLNSGGPAMTVVRLHDDRPPHDRLYRALGAQWFSGTELKYEDFNMDLLTKVK